jgi:hypothetical protein
MRKLAILLSLSVVGLPSLAMAADDEIVTLEGKIVANDKQIVGFVEHSAGVLLPRSCKVGSSNTSMCLADLMRDNWRLLNSFGVAPGDSYFVFSKKH